MKQPWASPTAVMAEAVQQAVDRLRAVGAVHEELIDDFAADVLKFCEARVFDDAKTIALCDLLADTLSQDFNVWQRTAHDSVAFFQEQLLLSSVARPPRSVGVFSPAEAASVLDYVAAGYFRHYKAYKYAFASMPTLQLKQTLPAGVVAPTKAPALTSAVLMDR